ncbi:MAG: dienelactone hydrolase family protein [Dysgonamonadaceae bacterium]|nr:dienelactone hydrolase family protein [Dysgonamonadaceae bacterium]
MKHEFITLKCFFIMCCTALPSFGQISNELKEKKADLALILRISPSEKIQNGRVSFLDKTFDDWLKRTGELPPNFDEMPSIPFLPNPLILDEGNKNIPVVTMAQWEEKREWMRQQLMKYITGTIPPAPDNLVSKVISNKMDGEVNLQMIELSFGPNHEAKLTMELMIPPGDGPFPVFLSQWNHREWAQIAVRRGYIGCVYAGADSKDDTEKYSEIWANEYDFTRLMRRAFGASRAIDYLYTIPKVDKEKIGITGHSRNGKLSLIAAAFDERITACIPSSGGTGAEVPWRYCSQNYDIEDIALLSFAQPAWLHPRLRFFIGREHKLPIDQNSLMALIAARGLMLSTALTEGAANVWGAEQAYNSTKEVYKFLGDEDKLAISSRYGLHSICARDMEDYIDFFDYVFEISDHKPSNRLFYAYSFDSWRKNSGENINLLDFPELETSVKVSSINEWENKKSKISKAIKWSLGDEPAGVTNQGPGSLDKSGRGEVSFGTFLVRPASTSKMGRMNITPYNGFGDQLFGYLYYPLDNNGEIKNNNLPVVIFLHEYDYSKGFNSYHGTERMIQSIVAKGFAVFTYDMIGFGNRIEEGSRFYSRYPHWSKMGKMVTDVKGAVEALVNLDFVNSEKIIVAGYSLGATVGLYASATDERINGVVSVAGFTPMRTNTLDRGTGGIMSWSHLHGLMPRLGFFVENESRIPYDFNEVLASIAPRPILIIAPELDKDAHLQDIKSCVEDAKLIYSLYNSPKGITLDVPNDINRFSPEMQEKMLEWLVKEL